MTCGRQLLHDGLGQHHSSVLGALQCPGSSASGVAVNHAVTGSGRPALSRRPAAKKSISPGVRPRASPIRRPTVPSSSTSDRYRPASSAGAPSCSAVRWVFGFCDQRRQVDAPATLHGPGK